MSVLVRAARGFHHTGFNGELKVARVVTEPIKGPGKRETFWIVTPDVELTAGDMRELAHPRGSIENHGFRTLNDAMNSKHVWTRGKNSEETFEALMLIMILSFLLVGAYPAQVDKEALWENSRLRRIPWRQLAEEWLMSISHAIP